jgi:hypothetical protein
MARLCVYKLLGNQAIVSVSDNKWTPLTDDFQDFEVGVTIHWMWYGFPNTKHTAGKRLR